MQLTLIHNEPSCRKCRDTQAILDAVAAETGACTVRSLSVGEAREQGFGVVLTPTVLVDNQVLCAGIVPGKAGLLRLVRGG
ncbi:MAG: thioredoxin family protein [Lentisphaeria bacterium]|jgi:hypothetical protein|nr:thioredoxin family protein [Lentisphaeria bacterium]